MIILTLALTLTLTLTLSLAHTKDTVEPVEAEVDTDGSIPVSEHTGIRSRVCLVVNRG